MPAQAALPSALQRSEPEQRGTGLGVIIIEAAPNVAIADGDTRLAAGVLDQAQPESPDGSVPTVAACTGLARGLLDQWLAGHDTDAPAGLATMTRLPAGHWTGERAAIDILTLARKGRAFASLDSLIVRQGGQHVLYGSALVLAAALQSWARKTETPLNDLARTVVRLLKPIPSAPSEASVATMAGIRLL